MHNADKDEIKNTNIFSSVSMLFIKRNSLVIEGESMRNKPKKLIDY